MKMRRGLVVGKFMPLHRGHQLLIETALANVDELTVVVYDSKVDFTDNPDYGWDIVMPAQKRAGWIAALYPGLQNLVVLGDPPINVSDPKERDDPKYAQVYADQVSFLGPFTHVFSSEDYGEPFARALGAQHVTVDASRELMPISGTTFRENMYEYRAYVDPSVYRSLIQKVVFVGTESTGKSTLAREMAKRLNTLHTEEFGRTRWEYLNSQDITPTFDELYNVAVTQYEQEQAAALHSNQFLFCDTNAWTTMMWSEMYHQTADARLYDLVERTKHEYIWFLCDNDFGWVDDGSRELRGDLSVDFHREHAPRLYADGIKLSGVLSGPIEQRVTRVLEHLGVMHGAYV